MNDFIEACVGARPPRVNTQPPAYCWNVVRAAGGSLHETLEETGILVEVDELTGVYKNTTRGIVALVFRCKPVGGSARTPSESIAVGLLTPDEVTEWMTEVYGVRLLDALDGPCLTCGAMTASA